jgi:hypothetical protein
MDSASVRDVSGLLVVGWLVGWLVGVAKFLAAFIQKLVGLSGVIGTCNADEQAQVE